eukprot:PhM_4_TR7555/c0_g1_i1/m.103253
MPPTTTLPRQISVTPIEYNLDGELNVNDVILNIFEYVHDDDESFLRLQQVCHAWRERSVLVPQFQNRDVVDIRARYIDNTRNRIEKGCFWRMFARYAEKTPSQWRTVMFLCYMTLVLCSYIIPSLALLSGADSVWTTIILFLVFIYIIAVPIGTSISVISNKIIHTKVKRFVQFRILPHWYVLFFVVAATGTFTSLSWGVYSRERWTTTGTSAYSVLRSVLAPPGAAHWSYGHDILRIPDPSVSSCGERTMWPDSGDDRSLDKEIRFVEFLTSSPYLWRPKPLSLVQKSEEHDGIDDGQVKVVFFAFASLRAPSRLCFGFNGINMYNITLKYVFAEEEMAKDDIDKEVNNITAAKKKQYDKVIRHWRPQPSPAIYRVVDWEYKSQFSSTSSENNVYSPVIMPITYEEELSRATTAFAAVQSGRLSEKQKEHLWHTGGVSLTLMFSWTIASCIEVVCQKFRAPAGRTQQQSDEFI